MKTHPFSVPFSLDRYIEQKSQADRIHGRCVVHADDNFDGRINYSDLTGNIQFNERTCLGACEHTRITNCHYTEDAICKYQLSVLNNLAHRKIDCVITSTGISQFS